MKFICECRWHKPNWPSGPCVVVDVEGDIPFEPRAQYTHLHVFDFLPHITVTQSVWDLPGQCFDVEAMGNWCPQETLEQTCRKLDEAGVKYTVENI